MRHIPTTTSTVEALKRQAKKLQRKGGGKHGDLLDRVARGAGYDHWHHVTLCLKATENKTGVEALLAECKAIVTAALNRREKLIVTGPEVLARTPLVLFASAGDAWLLEPREGLATCLLFKDQPLSFEASDVDGQVRIGWDGTFSLNGNSFEVSTGLPEVGTRSIQGYAIDRLREVVHDVQSFEDKFASTILQTDAIDITPEIIEQLVADGWERSTLEQAIQAGARYSPSRHSVLTVPEFG